MSVTLSPLQEQAMTKIVHWYTKEKEKQVFYLYGYAGTGKSTIVDFAIQHLRAHAGVGAVVTAAYTGKAASVLKKKGVPNAQTIHSLLYHPKVDKDGKLSFTKKLYSEGEDADLIILDEVSMVGEDIARDVKALGKKILVVGDPGQLPPIDRNPGFFTLKPDVFLDEIHRQALDSPIIRLATMTRNKEELPRNFNEGGVIVMPFEFNAVQEALRGDTQVLCGTHNRRFATTKTMRKNLGHEGDMPRAGEPIIACRTNYKYGFFNGQVGVFDKVEFTKVNRKGQDVDDPLVCFRLDDIESPFTKLPLDPYLFHQHFTTEKLKPSLQNMANQGDYVELDWAYALTVHKAQGSSFPHTTIFDEADVFRDDKWKWRYTALTRAESGLIIFQTGRR